MDVVAAVSASRVLVNSVAPNTGGIFHASLSCSLFFPSLKWHNMSPINYRGMIEENVVDCVRSLGKFKPKSLLGMSFHKQPSDDDLRTIGCLCFATSLNRHDKLDARGTQCILLGNSKFIICK